MPPSQLRYHAYSLKFSRNEYFVVWLHSTQKQIFADKFLVVNVQPAKTAKFINLENFRLYSICYCMIAPCIALFEMCSVKLHHWQIWYYGLVLWLVHAQVRPWMWSKILHTLPNALLILRIFIQDFLREEGGDLLQTKAFLRSQL